MTSPQNKLIWSWAQDTSLQLLILRFICFLSQQIIILTLLSPFYIFRSRKIPSSWINLHWSQAVILSRFYSKFFGAKWIAWRCLYWEFLIAGCWVREVKFTTHNGILVAHSFICWFNSNPTYHRINFDSFLMLLLALLVILDSYFGR